MPFWEKQSCVRRFHIYKSVWTPCIGEILSCSRETSNLHDQFAVKVLKVETDSQAIVGHLPRSISSTCSIFFEERRNHILQNQRNKKIFERFSTGRIRSSLYVSIRSRGRLVDCRKLRKSFYHSEKQKSEIETPSKKIKLENKENEGGGNKISPDCLWVSLKDSRIELYDCDNQGIVKGHKLNDLHILFGQSLLKNQFPEVQGLSCTLTQSRLRFDMEKDIVQICHVRNDHWIVISNLLCGAGKINVFDSVYSDIDESTEALIVGMFDQPVELKMFPIFTEAERRCGLWRTVECSVLLYA